MDLISDMSLLDSEYSTSTTQNSPTFAIQGKNFANFKSTNNKIPNTKRSKKV